MAGAKLRLGAMVLIARGPYASKRRRFVYSTNTDRLGRVQHIYVYLPRARESLLSGVGVQVPRRQIVWDGQMAAKTVIEEAKKGRS